MDDKEVKLGRGCGGTWVYYSSHVVLFHLWNTKMSVRTVWGQSVHSSTGVGKLKADVIVIVNHRVKERQEKLVLLIPKELIPIMRGPHEVSKYLVETHLLMQRLL